MNEIVSIIAGFLIIFLALLIFITQKFSWARQYSKESSYWPNILAGLTSLFFMLTIASGLWFRQYITFFIILLLFLIASPVLYNLFEVIKKKGTKNKDTKE